MARERLPCEMWCERRERRQGAGRVERDLDLGLGLGLGIERRRERRWCAPPMEKRSFWHLAADD